MFRTEQTTQHEPADYTSATHSTSHVDMKLNPDQTAVTSDNCATADDEDDLLYGDTGASIPTVESEESVDTAPTANKGELPDGEPKPTYWAVLATDKGELEVCTTFDIVFNVH